MQLYVAGFLFRNNNTEVALVEKQKPQWQKGLFNGIGGKIESEDFSPLSAMIREFKEETGALVSDWNQFLLLEGNDWKVYFFKSFSGDDVELKTIETEIISWNVINEELYNKTLRNLKWLIPLALDKDNITAIVRDNGII